MRVHRDLDAAPEPPVLDISAFGPVMGLDPDFIIVNGRVFDLRVDPPPDAEGTFEVHWGPNGIFSVT